mmetsp:Transcript_125235/g.227132  ORF Transcript_125235/g.227132 Transcript_125235/m.227132 type:complete len:150 (+) Transcript_125235:53-502(+)
MKGIESAAPRGHGAQLICRISPCVSSCNMVSNTRPHGLEQFTQTVPRTQIRAAVTMGLGLLENLDQVQKLLVMLISVPTPDQNAIVCVASHRDGRVVHEDALIQWASQEAEFLEKGTTQLRAMTAIEAVFNPLALRIKGVQHLVCVGLL